MIAATLAKALQGGGPYPLDGYGRFLAPCIGTAQSNGHARAKEENKQPNGKTLLYIFGRGYVLDTALKLRVHSLLKP